MGATVAKHAVKRITRSGSTPRYVYRGVVIVSSAGTTYGRGWLFFTGSVARFSTTLSGAKFMIDQMEGEN